MQAEYLVLDDSSQRQEVKQISQVLPYVGVAVLAQTLVVETINLRDLPTLMISSQNSDAVFKSNFEADK